MANQHCIPCERKEDWLEIDIRDENNQQFFGITATVTDSVGTIKTLVLQGGPELVIGLAPGEVTVQLDTQPWLSAAMNRQPRAADECSKVEEYAGNKLGFKKTEKTYLHATCGDLVLDPPETSLAERHQAGKGDSGEIKLCTNQSYVFEVKAHHWLTVRMGLFFDGTGNNTDNALWGREQREQHINNWMKKCGADAPEALQAMQDACEAPDGVEVEGSGTNELTNVQKLKDLYIDDEFEKEFLYQIGEYIQGIGTSLEAPTDEEGMDGDDLIGSATGRGDTGVESRVEEGYIKIIENFKELHWPKIENIYDGIGKFEFETFGFSRGAAAARHCVNQILLEKDNPVEAYIKEVYTDIPLHPDFDWQNNNHCHVRFVGIFDTVAAIGLISDMGNANNDNNGDVKLYLDSKRVGKVVHLTAHPRDEFRHNFSLNHLNNASSDPSSDFFEMALPGVHSDVGGGYPSRHFFSGKLQQYAPFFTDKKLVAVETCTLYGSPKSWTEAKIQQSGAYTKVALERQRLVQSNWGNLAQFSIGTTITPIRGRRGGEVRKGILVVKLTMSRIVEGDLSRLALRLMAGLAENKGVKWDSAKNESVWLEDDNYVITDLNSHYQILGQSFANISQQVLEQAKKGKVMPLLLSEDFHLAMRPNFVHHSSGFESTMGVAPNVPNHDSVRTLHPCREGQ